MRRIVPGFVALLVMVLGVVGVAPVHGQTADSTAPRVEVLSPPEGADLPGMEAWFKKR